MFNFNQISEWVTPSFFLSVLLFLILTYLFNNAVYRKRFIDLCCNSPLLLCLAASAIGLFMLISSDGLCIYLFTYNGKAHYYHYLRDLSSTVLPGLSSYFICAYIAGLDKTWLFFFDTLEKDGPTLDLLPKTIWYLDVCTGGAFFSLLFSFALSRLLFFIIQRTIKFVRTTNLLHPNEHSHTSAMYFFIHCVAFTAFLFSVVFDLPFTIALDISFFVWAPSCLYFGEYSQILTLWVYIDHFRVYRRVVEALTYFYNLNKPYLIHFYLQELRDIIRYVAAGHDIHLSDLEAFGVELVLIFFLFELLYAFLYDQVHYYWENWKNRKK